MDCCQGTSGKSVLSFGLFAVRETVGHATLQAEPSALPPSTQPGRAVSSALTMADT